MTPSPATRRRFLEVASLGAAACAVSGPLGAAGAPKRDALFWHYPHYGNQGGAPGGAVRLGDWKLIEWFEDDHVELYNLKDDLGERHDLAAKMPEKADELRKLLRDWRKSVNANMPRANPDYAPAGATPSPAPATAPATR